MIRLTDGKTIFKPISKNHLPITDLGAQGKRKFTCFFYCLSGFVVQIG